MNIYDVDKEFVLPKGIIVKLDKEVSLFGECDLDIGVRSTTPLFLGRLRRVLYDGTITSPYKCNEYIINKNDMLFINNEPPYDVSVLNSTGIIYKFIGQYCEELVPYDIIPLPDVSSVEFWPQSYIESFMDLFKIDRKKNEEELSKLLEYYNAGSSFEFDDEEDDRGDYYE